MGQWGRDDHGAGLVDSRVDWLVEELIQGLIQGVGWLVN